MTVAIFCSWQLLQFRVQFQKPSSVRLFNMARGVFFLFLTGINLLRCESIQFIIRRSTSVQYAGGVVEGRLTIAVSRDTPAYVKFKVPFNQSAALFEITDMLVAGMEKNLTANGNTTATMTSSAGNHEMDIAVIDMGNITHASPVGTLNLLDIDFKFRVLDHVLNTCGSTHWVSIGVEYFNQSVFAAQLSITVTCPISPRPVLDVSADVVDADRFNFISGPQVVYSMTIGHGDSSSAKAKNGTLEWIMPSFLTYASHAVETGAVTVVGSGSVVQFKFGLLTFSNKIKFKITADITNSAAIEAGKVHDLTAFGKLRYDGPADLSCVSSSGSRRFKMRKPVTLHFKFYKRVAACDSALGMENGDITNATIMASSHAADGPPWQARLNVGKGWIPSGNYKYRNNQYLQVEFSSRKIIRRVSTQMGKAGVLKGRTRAFKLYFSDDGHRWTPYIEGNKIKEFTGNDVEDQTQHNVLLTPIEAKFVRIMPTKWENGIALRAEFHGCNAVTPAPSAGPVVYSSRGYLLDKDTNTMYVCSCGLQSKPRRATCYFTKDNGVTWTAVDHRVLYIVGYDPDTKFLYGVDRKGLTVMESTEEHEKGWKCVPVSSWTHVDAKSNKVLAVDAASILMTDDPNAVIPQAPHIITATNRQTWGASASGIHVYNNGTSQWLLKASWYCNQ